MPTGTTDLDFGPSKKELEYRAAVDKAGILAGGELARQSMRESGETERERMKTPGAFSYTGVPGQFRRQPQTAGREVQAFARGTAAGKELGAETSYGGQAPLKLAELSNSENAIAEGRQDFSRPIAVTRGMTTTYQGPQYGEEFTTPGQAAQAFRRDQGAAPFVPTGGPLEALKGKSAEASMAQNIMTGKKNLEAFMNRVQSDPRFYKEGPEGLMPISPGLGQLLLGFKAMGEVDPDKAWQAFEAKATRHLDETRWVNDQGVTKVIENLTKQGFTLTPGQKAWLSTPQTDSEQEKKRRDTILQWVNPTAIPSGQPPATVQPSQPGMPQPLTLGRSSLQDRAGITNFTPGGNPLSPPPALQGPASAFLLRPDQMGQLTENFQKEAKFKENLAALSKDMDERLRHKARE